MILNFRFDFATRLHTHFCNAFITCGGTDHFSSRSSFPTRFFFFFSSSGFFFFPTRKMKTNPSQSIGRLFVAGNFGGERGRGNTSSGILARVGQSDGQTTYLTYTKRGWCHSDYFDPPKKKRIISLAAGLFSPSSMISHAGLSYLSSLVFRLLTRAVVSTEYGEKQRVPSSLCHGIARERSVA